MKKWGIIAGLAAVASALLPSPTTIATFKPWKAEDRTVRIVFWLSIAAGAGLVMVLVRAGNG